MTSQEKSDQNNSPLSKADRIPLLDDMKSFVYSAIRASECVLREEIHTVRNELKQDIQAVKTELGQKIDLVHCAITEHSKSIKEHDNRLTILEQNIS